MLIPSATVILLSQRENDAGFDLLLLRRNAKLKTHGGSWVFPGGKVDQEEYAALSSDFYSLAPSQQLAVTQRTACREVHEEAGIRLLPERLKLFSTWLTPPSMPKRFDARFFIAEVESRDVQIDEGEIHDYQWISPKDALESQSEGALTLPPPTFVSLRYLSKYASAAQAIMDLSHRPMHFKPRLVAVNGGFCSLYEDDAAYQSEDLSTPGVQHRLMIVNGRFEYIRTI